MPLRTTRGSLVAGALLVASALAIAGGAPPAGAVGPTCTASSTTTFAPGLLLQERQQHIEFDVGFANCITPGRGDITSGTRSGDFDGPRGCLSLPPSASGQFEVTWNTGETSTVSGTATGVDAGGQTVLTLTGTVTDGLFTGSAYTEVITQASINLLQCLAAPGITSQTGLGAVTIL